MGRVGLGWGGFGIWVVAAGVGLAQVSAGVSPEVRAGRFLAGRTTASGGSGARALGKAREQHLALVRVQAASVARAEIAKPRTAGGLSAAWEAVGPAQIASQSFGLVTGRVTAVAIDPADATGNTVYVGTTGGGVWKSVNAAGAAGSVSFAPLTDTLPVFSASAGTVAVPSLSIGAVSVGPAASGSVVLAGTGDTNDASDSYYGEGILRSADGGVTWTLAQESKDGIAGTHSFVGLGVAGFAWDSATPELVVAAVGAGGGGSGGECAERDYSVMGLYYSTDAGVTWQMATILDGSQVVQQPCWGRAGKCGDGGGVECGAADVLCGGAGAWVLPVSGWSDVDADGEPAGDGVDGGGVPGERGGELPDLSRGAGGAGGDRRHVCADGGCEQCGPGVVAGCLRGGKRGRELCERDSDVGDKAGVGAAGGGRWCGRWEYGDCAGGLRSGAGGGGDGGGSECGYAAVCGDGGFVSVFACGGVRAAQYDECGEWVRGAGDGGSGATCDCGAGGGGGEWGGAGVCGERWRGVAVGGWGGRDGRAVLGETMRRTLRI